MSQPLPSLRQEVRQCSVTGEIKHNRVTSLCVWIGVYAVFTINYQDYCDLFPVTKDETQGSIISSSTLLGESTVHRFSYNYFSTPFSSSIPFMTDPSLCLLQILSFKSCHWVFIHFTEYWLSSLNFSLLQLSLIMNRTHLCYLCLFDHNTTVQATYPSFGFFFFKFGWVPLRLPTHICGFYSEAQTERASLSLSHL